MSDVDLRSELEAEMDDIPAAAPEGDALTRMQALAERVCVIDEQIATLDERKEARMKVRNDIMTRQLVDLMDEHRVDNVGVRGLKFVMDDFYHASIKEENRDEAHDWLEAHEAGDLIKYTVTVTFSKNSMEQAQALADYARQRYQDAAVENTRGVPWKRLTSWLKELIERKRVESDDSVVIPPLDVMGATVGRVVKIEKPRKPRGK